MRRWSRSCRQSVYDVTRGRANSQSEITMHDTTTKLLIGALMLGALALAAPAQAQTQTYPTRPVRFIVPFPPGGVADVTARLIGQKLTEALGQQAVIENRPGASGTLGADAASKA